MCSFKWKLVAHLWIYCCVASSFLTGGSAQTAVGTGEENYSCPASLSPDCSCYNPKNPETFGWLISCSDDNVNVSYTIEYSYSEPGNPSSDSQYTLICVTSQPLARGFFRRFTGHGGEQTRNFEFQSCVLPFNVSLADALDGLSVQSLSFECEVCRPNSADALGTPLPYDELEELTLTNYNFSDIPENLFGQLVSLRVLVLNGDVIRVIPENLFANQSKLEQLDLYNNSLEAVPDNLFRNLAALKRLNLGSNRIKEINGNAFRYLVSLQELNIVSNMIVSLSPDAFQSIKNLSSLLLLGNKLQTIVAGTFDNNSGLTFLDLRRNTALSNLPETLGEGVVSLQKFYLSQCNISSIPKNLLLNAFNLTEFQINGNSIGSIPAGLFASSSSLTRLDLSDNRLSSLPRNIFLNNSNLKYLDFSNNRFGNFPSEELQNLEQLEELHLEGNNLTEFGNLARSYSLRKITLQNNKIRNILGSNQPFGRAVNLTTVDLSHNRFREFLDVDWGFYPELQTLNLQYNEITSLDMKTVDLLQFEIHLENNNISHFVRDTAPIYHDTEHKRSLYLKGNPLNCDCFMLDIQKTPFADEDDLVCSSPSNLANVSLLNVKEEDFVCPIEDLCPKECACVFRAVFSTTEVACAKQNMSELPSVIPANTSVLDFRHNSLKTLAALRGPLWNNLTTLIVDDNQVTSDGLYFPVNLKSLSVQRNSLTVVPSVLAVWTSAARSLSLEGNPWRCDCDGLGLKQLLADPRGIIHDKDRVLCAKPTSLSLKPVDSLREKDLCPSDMNNSGVYITAIAVCVPLLALIFVLCVLYIRNRKMIVAYIYIHCYKIFLIFFRESDMDEDKPFHAFVSYSSSDSEVTKALVEELEKKEPYFRLCIHERDWLPGQLITWNIVRSVQNSRRTILVLSRDFLKSVWFQLEFHIAYYQMMEDRIDRLIVVVHGDLPDKAELDGDLQFLLSTKSYLVWKERWFWEKLRYALPHKKDPSSCAPPRKPDVQCPSSELLQKIEGKIMSLTQKTVECPPSGVDGQPVELDEANRSCPPVLLHQDHRIDSSSV